MASSKTVLRPFWVRAEHSRYLTAPTSLAMANPCRNSVEENVGVGSVCYTWGYVIGANLFSFSLSMVSLSSLRSSLVPTRMMGTCGQWCLTSGYHLALTFSKLAGLTREKQMRKTSWAQWYWYSVLELDGDSPFEGRREVSVYRSPPDLQCPTVPGWLVSRPPGTRLVLEATPHWGRLCHTITLAE